MNYTPLTLHPFPFFCFIFPLGREMRAADKRSDKQFIGDSDSLQLSVGAYYMVHSNVDDKSSDSSYFLASVMAVISTADELAMAIANHFVLMTKTWNAWGRQNHKIQMAKENIEREIMNINSMKEIWESKFNDDKNFRIAQILWHENKKKELKDMKDMKGSSSGSGGDNIPIHWSGPWCPHHLTHKYQWIGLIGTEAFVAKVKTVNKKAGYRAISMTEQKRLIKLPSQGKIFQLLEEQHKESLVGLSPPQPGPDGVVQDAVPLPPPGVATGAARRQAPKKRQRRVSLVKKPKSDGVAAVHKKRRTPRAPLVVSSESDDSDLTLHTSSDSDQSMESEPSHPEGNNLFIFFIFYKKNYYTNYIYLLLDGVSTTESDDDLDVRISDLPSGKRKREAPSHPEGKYIYYYMFVVLP